MKRFDPVLLRTLFWSLASALVFFVVVPQSAMAAPAACNGKLWNANAGAETKDQSVQADAFLPNEVWIDQNDCIEWTFVPQNEVHTVTFLTAGETRPQAPPPVGPPAGPTALPLSCYSPAPTSYSGTCASSGALAGGQTFKLTFPTPGNYKLVCLVHTDMNGTVHVLPTGSNLPYDQFDYDRQAQEEAKIILADDDHDNHQRDDRDDHGWGRNDDHTVLAGTGKIVATGGGLQYRAVLRFFPETLRIHAGESVVWTNIDPTEPHTITFGTEPGGLPPFVPTTPYNLGPPEADGTLTATTNSCGGNNAAGKAECDMYYAPEPGQSPSLVPGSGTYVPTAFLNSGFVAAQAPDRTGSAQLPPGTTRIKITFPTAGTYYYHCALHDVDGMYGAVIVE